MADSIEKRLITAFSTAWGVTARTKLGRDSALGLLALREVSGDGVEAALAVAATWSSGFFANCSGALQGVLICLFKSEDSNEIERLMKQPVDGLPKPGGRALVNAALAGAAESFANTEPPLVFGEVKYLELTGQEKRLATIVGDKAWVGTFALSIGDEQTQALLLYGPHGSMQAQPGTAPVAAEPQPSTAAHAAAPAAAASQPNVSRRTARPQEPAPRNLERLLGVELEIIVRFGTTNMLLRDVVRLGTGMMIELNRAVDEPVELLVNGRPLARGEVVVIDGYYGVRITEIGAPQERPLSLIAPGAQG